MSPLTISRAHRTSSTVARTSRADCGASTMAETKVDSAEHIFPDVARRPATEAAMLRGSAMEMFGIALFSQRCVTDVAGARPGSVVVCVKS
jgi:hypothetical protein